MLTEPKRLTRLTRKIFLLQLLLLSFASYAQNHKKTASEEFDYQANIILDVVNNLSGGIKKGSQFLALASFSLDYNPRQGVFKNTSFHGHLLKTAGDSPSENLIGDIQIASNIEGRSSRFIYELYIKQKLGDFIISAGLHDMNADFMFSKHAGDFINSSFGIAPTVSINMPVSIFPVTTLGGYLSYSREKFDISVALYNLNHHFAQEESFRLKNHLYQHGYLGLTELCYRIIAGDETTGEYKIGAFIKDCEPHENGDHAARCPDQKNHGFYFVGDQTLLRAPSGKNLNAFVQLGITPEKKNFASAYYGGGISLKGFSSQILLEQIGLALGCVKLNTIEEGAYREVKGFETVVELTSSFSLLNWINLQPDFQYIINPSGQYENAFVILLRLKANLLT